MQYYIIRECLHEETIVGEGQNLEEAELKREAMSKTEKNVWASYILKAK